MDQAAEDSAACFVFHGREFAMMTGITIGRILVTRHDTPQSLCPVPGLRRFADLF